MIRLTQETARRLHAALVKRPGCAATLWAWQCWCPWCTENIMTAFVLDECGGCLPGPVRRKVKAKLKEIRNG
jgi:hypothetical protein